MVRKIVNRFAALCCGLIAGYLLFLITFSISTASIAKQASDLYQAYNKSGFNEEVSESYLALLPKLEKFVDNSQTILLRPLVEISGQSEVFTQSIELYKSVSGILPTLPWLAGIDEPKRYFVAFQNPAEARGTGGLVGAFAIIEISNGKFEVKKVGSNYLLALQDEMPVSLPSEFKNLYGDHPAWWPNSNMSPHFPYAGKIWLGLWKKQYGDDLDGAIALDPFALRDILEVTGEVKVRDTLINSDNVIKETLFESYIRYRDDNVNRKEYLVEIIDNVMKSAFSSETNQAQLLWSLRDSIRENRVLLYAANKDMQRIIENSPLSGSLDLRSENQFRLVIQNTAGNKMDYYISREVELVHKTCGARGITQARVKISNTAPKNLDLPDNYFGRTDQVDNSNPENSTSIAALMYGAKGAKLVAAYDVTNDRAIGYLKKERGRQILVVPLELKAGQTQELLVDFQGFKSPIYDFEQPLVIPQLTSVKEGCR
jgi:hypothetical protein